MGKTGWEAEMCHHAGCPCICTAPKGNGKQLGAGQAGCIVTSAQ